MNNSALNENRAKDIEATVIGLADLIILKKQAGRTKDLDDIDKLSAIKEEDLG